MTSQIRLWLLAICLLSPSLLIAQTHLQVRSEESRWVAEVIGTAADGWPEILERRSYPTEEQAQQQMQIWQTEMPLATLSDLSSQPQMASGVLWSTREAWSEAWEIEYGRWIEREVDPEFYVRHNIATDCADVAYSLRWIFARIHGLPAAAKIGGSKVLMTNETLRSEWSRLPTANEWNKDKRFLAALNYLLRMTYTHTLWGDSFPVALKREALLSGSYHLSLKDRSGHTQVVHWLSEEPGAPFLTLNSTVPRKVRTLMDSMLAADPSEKGKSALLRFRWAVKSRSGIILKPIREMPGYSEEQFEFKPEKDYTLELFEKLGVKATREDLADYILKDIFDQFSARVEIVQEGFQKCQQMKCNPGTQGWEDWSTPSRDDRIHGKIASLDGLLSNPKSPWLQKSILQTEGTSWTVKSLIWNWRHKVYTSDPRENEATRWGAGKESWVLNQIDYLQSKLKERQKHFESIKGKCSMSNCPFGSDGWNRNSSDSIDKNIRERIVYITGSRTQIPSDIISVLDQRLPEFLFQHGSFKWTLEEFLKSAIKMNSSPFATESEQWGQQAHSGTVELPGSQPLAMNRWIYSIGESTVFDTQSESQTTVAGKFLIGHPGSSLVLLRDGAQVHIYDLEHNENDGLTIPWTEKTSVVQFQPPYLTVFNGVDSETYQRTAEKTWLKTETLTGKWRASVADMPFLIQESKLYDPRRKILLSTSREIDFGIYRESDRYEFITFFTSPGFAIEKSSGKVRTLSSKGALIWSSSDGRRALINTGVTDLYEVSDDLVFTKKRELGGWCSLQDNAILSCFSTGEIRFFELRGDEFAPLTTPKGTFSVNSTFFATRDGDLSRIVDRKSGKVLLSAYRVLPLTSNLVAASLGKNLLFHIVDIKSPQAPLLTNTLRPHERFGWFALEAKSLPRSAEAYWIKSPDSTIYLRR